MRCTVPGLTPNRSAILRTPSVRPGWRRASRIAVSSSGAIGGLPSLGEAMEVLAAQVAWKLVGKRLDLFELPFAKCKRHWFSSCAP